MKRNKYTAFLGLLMAFPSVHSDAKELVSADVPVTFTLTRKAPTGAVYPRDPVTGKELKSEELDSSSEYTVTNADGSTKETTVWGLKTVTYKVSNKELIQGQIDDGNIAGPLAGWAIMASPTVSSDETSWTVSYKIYFARGSETSDWFTVSITNAEMASAGSFTRTVSASGTIISRNKTGTCTYEKPFFTTVENSQLAGILSCTTKTVTYYASYPGLLQFLEVPNASKITNLLAADDDCGHTTGTIAFGASRAINAP